MPKRSSANTITLLAIFNRTIGLLCYELLGKSPILYSPQDIRRALTIEKIIPSKEQVPTFLELYLDIKFPWKYNKKTKIINENFDMADGCAAALCHLLNTNDRQLLSQRIEKSPESQKILQEIAAQNLALKQAKALKKKPRKKKIKKPK